MTQISVPGNRAKAQFLPMLRLRGLSNKACARRGNPSAGPARGPAALPSAEIDQAHRRGPTGDCGGPSTGRLFERWPVLRPSRTFKRRQPAARPRILHTRRHDQAERARCRVMVRDACQGRLWPQQVHQTGVKACRRRAVVARAETAAEEPSAVASQRLPGSPSGSPCPF